MNTPGKNNGVFEGWLNGQLGVRLTDVQYRTAKSPTLRTDTLAMTTFYGGPYANKSAQTAMFDDLEIRRAR